MKLSSRWEDLWSPKVGFTQLLWHSFPGASNAITIGLCDFWKIPTLLHIWVYECFRCKYLSKSHNKVVMMGRSVPMLFSSSEVYLLSNFVERLKPLQNEETFNIAFKKIYFNLLYSICVMSIYKQKICLNEGNESS